MAHPSPTMQPPGADQPQPPRASPSHPAAASEEEAEQTAPRSKSEPHTQSEEYAAYAAFAFLVTALILACVGLSNVSWRVAQANTQLAGTPDEAFGVVYVHLAGETHYLETMGLVWRCYAASRCVLGFTIIGIILTMWALLRITAFIRNNRGSIIGVMGVSIFIGLWYIGAIILYSIIWPQNPFKGDLFYMTAGSNFTTYTHETQTIELSSRLQQQPPQQQLHIEHTQLSQPIHQLTTLHHPQQLSSRDDLASISLSAASPPPVAFRSLATSGVPVFNTPSSDPYSASISASQLAKQMSYAKMAYDHLNTKWQYGKGYYLVLGAFICTVVLPGAGVLLAIVWWLWERHKAADGIQHWHAVPFVLLLYIGFLLALIGFGSRFWKIAHAPLQGSQNHFGLDVAVLGGIVYDPIRDIPLTTALGGDDGSRVRHVSAAALALGILGVFSGFAACVAATYHMYDKSREPPLVGILCTITAVLWLILLIAYGAVFPHYVAGNYYEFGWSFWIVLVADIIFFLPFLALIAYLIARRAMKTTREERILAIPVSCSIFAVIFTMAALGSDAWLERRNSCDAGPCPWQSDHLGLLRGRLEGVWMELQELSRHTSTGLIRAGLVALVMMLCGVVVQVPATIMGIMHVSGRHEQCGAGQMHLLATALSLTAFCIQVLGMAGYAYLVPMHVLPQGYIISNSWRVGVAAAVWSLFATVGFAILSKPPEPGEPNILAAAVHTKR